MILLLIFSALPNSLHLEDEVDIIEWNTVFNQDGNLSLDQLIFWKLGWTSQRIRLLRS